MIKLFIIRHGEAEPFSSKDSERQLTEIGRSEVAAVTRQVATDLSSASHLWVSPYVRAQQTAEIVCQSLPSVSKLTTSLLTPEASPTELGDAIEQAGIESLVLVSHQPLVGRFVDGLCGLEPGRIFMGTSCIACIETELLAADMGHLLYLQTPQGQML